MCSIQCGVTGWLFIAYQVQELLWNNESTVLAIWLEDLKSADEGNKDGQQNTYGNKLSI